MSLLTIYNALALNVGMEQVDQVYLSSKRECVEAVALANLVGEELARRVDFGSLRQTSVLSGGVASYELDPYFSRIIPGVGVTSGGRIVRPLTSSEWESLPSSTGAARYFSLRGRTIEVWPTPTATTSLAVTWQSDAWCSNGTNKWAADSDTSLIDEDLFGKGLIVRWRRQKGMDYADYEAEFEAALENIATFDDRSRL